MAKSRSSPPSPSCSTPCSDAVVAVPDSPTREPTSSVGGVGVPKSMASPPSFASVLSPTGLLPPSLGGGEGGGADHSVFKSNDARGGISGLLGANGEIPVIGVDGPCCAGPAADDSPTGDTGESEPVGLEAGAGADSGGSSSM